MNLFGTIAGSVKGMMHYSDKKEDLSKLKEMGHEELMSTANRLKNENVEFKERIMTLEKENGLLRHCVINNEKESSSHFGKLVNSLKTTFLSMDDDNDDFNEKNINDFKAFLYNQSLFFGGIEEEDINHLNQFVNKSDEDWKANKDVFLFKQTILERNYRELLSNILVSPELNAMMIKKYGKDKIKNNTPISKSNNNDKIKDQMTSTPDNLFQYRRSKETILSPEEINIKDTGNENKTNKTISDKLITTQLQIAKAKTLENTTPVKKQNENTNINMNMKAKEYISNNKANQIKKSDPKKDALASNNIYIIYYIGLLFDNNDDDEDDIGGFN